MYSIIGYTWIWSKPITSINRELHSHYKLKASQDGMDDHKTNIFFLPQHIQGVPSGYVKIAIENTPFIIDLPI